MKKWLIGFGAAFLLVVTLMSGTMVYAAEANQAVNNNQQSSNLLANGMSENTQGELRQLKEKSTSEMQSYIDKYGSQTYGVAAYILNKVRIYSIPFCFVGIAIGAIYQYVIGIRKLDVRDKGFGVVIAFVTILIICQVLPLIFAIVVKGWRD